MSLYNERIDVRSTTGGHPALFTWRGDLYRVRRIIGTWDRPATARLVRVAAESSAGTPSIADIAVDPATHAWTLRRHWS
ncbi:DUF6504 family protein [Nocardiopsis coralliicola]